MPFFGRGDKAAERGCAIIHRITGNKRNVLAPRITHGLDGKRPVRSRNRICVMYSHADFADDADFYHDTFLCPTEKRLSKKICVICEICVTLIICGHVFMTHPLFILPPGIKWMPGGDSGASRPKFSYLLNYPKNPSHFRRCNPLLPPSG